MRGRIRFSFLPYAVLSLCVIVGCGSKGPTHLCDGFQSYETAQSVRNRLSQWGVKRNWQEKSQSVGPPDRRSAYQMLTMSGPFSLNGYDGSLKLVFYDDQLMSTEFTTPHGKEYIAHLQEEYGSIPKGSGTEIEINRRTEFKYFIEPDGAFRFLWTDPKLESKWNEWVRANA